MSPLDFDPVSIILRFDTCDTQKCTVIHIVDDMTSEKIESFFVTLERTSGLDNRIVLDPPYAEVEITNNDGMQLNIATSSKISFEPELRNLMSNVSVTSQ